MCGLGDDDGGVGDTVATDTATRGHLVDGDREEEIFDGRRTNWNKILMPICPRKRPSSKSSCSRGAFSVVLTFCPIRSVCSEYEINQIGGGESRFA